MLSADWSDGVRWGPIGSDWVPMGSDVARLGPMGSDWVISHTASGSDNFREHELELPIFGSRDSYILGVYI